jgi:hypothetical protein
MEQVLNEKLNTPELKRNHDLAIWFVGDVQGESLNTLFSRIDHASGNS